MVRLKIFSRDIFRVAHEYMTKNSTELGKTPYKDRYGNTSVPPPTAVITRESFKLSIIVFTNAIMKNKNVIGTNCPHNPSNFFT
jgi:hypothetical protein